MNKEQIIYKVVQKRTLKSSCMNIKGITIQYKVGKFVKPLLRRSKIYAFLSLNDAKWFAGTRFTVYKAIGKNVGIPKLLTYLPGSIDIIKNLWISFRRGDMLADYNRFTDFDFNMFGKSAVWCDEVKLVTRIR